MALVTWFSFNREKNEIVRAYHFFYLLDKNFLLSEYSHFERSNNISGLEYFFNKNASSNPALCPHFLTLILVRFLLNCNKKPELESEYCLLKFNSPGVRQQY